MVNAIAFSPDGMILAGRAQMGYIFMTAKLS
jgi:hypothetical protein